MPEGDTIFKMAARLRPALAGQRLRRFEARVPPPPPPPGERIDSVEAKGKHLLIAFSGGLTLQTHMAMTGSWRLFETGARWSRPAHLARCVIEVEGWKAVCFSAPTVRLVAAAVEEPAAHL